MRVSCLDLRAGPGDAVVEHGKVMPADGAGFVASLIGSGPFAAEGSGSCKYNGRPWASATSRLARIRRT
ncbi:MAG: hypothetical protein AMXMBFR81_04230 [Chthonomonas sp.]